MRGQIGLQAVEWGRGRDWLLLSTEHKGSWTVTGASVHPSMHLNLARFLD